MRLCTRDPYDWPTTPQVVFEERDARDACLQQFGGVWHWYYVQRFCVEGVERSCVMLRTGRDLAVWSAGAPVFVDRSRSVQHSRLESPFVMAWGGRYWLLVRDRNREGPGYPAPATLWVSTRPDHFEWAEAPVTVFSDLQAPEFVEHEGRLYVARVSGVSHACGHRHDTCGWLEIAPVRW